MSVASIPLEIIAGRTIVLPISWLAPEAAGRDLQAATLSFGMRRELEDEALAFVGGTVVASSEITALLTLSADETAGLSLGRYAQWGVLASFNDGGAFEIAEGVATVRSSAP